MESKKDRTQRETDNMVNLIKQAKQLKKIDSRLSVDKTPASVTKYKSGGGKSYQVKLDQPSEEISRDKLEGAIG